MKIFSTDDLPGIGEAIRKIFPETDCQLCGLHAARDALNKARRNDREALAQDLKAVYRAETEEEGKEALWKPRERWGATYPRVVAWDHHAHHGRLVLPPGGSWISQPSDLFH